MLQNASSMAFIPAYYPDLFTYLFPSKIIPSFFSIPHFRKCAIPQLQEKDIEDL